MRFHVSCASPATASTMSTRRSSSGVAVVRPIVPTGVGPAVPPPPSSEKKFTPVNMLRRATIMNPPMPSGMMVLQRIAFLRPLAEHRACQPSSSERGFQQALYIPVREHHGGLPLERLVVAARKRLLGFRGHEQTIDVLEQRARIRFGRHAVRSGHLVDPHDEH